MTDRDKKGDDKPLHKDDDEEEDHPLVAGPASFEIEQTRSRRRSVAPLLALLFFSSFRVRVIVFLIPILTLAGLGGYLIQRNISNNSLSIQFHSGIPRYDKAFQLALREVAGNIQEDGTFMAGAGWTQLWTRDTSYALELSLALLYPKESEKTIRKLTQESSSGATNFGRTWYQDECGHFGGWPHLSDAIVGAQGSWSLYMATGNVEFLEWAHNITQNTLRWAHNDVFDPQTNLFKGCSSFMESNSGYPSEYRMNGHMVGETKALSTNVLYYTGYRVAASMIGELKRVAPNHQPSPTSYTLNDLQEGTNLLKRAITERLWMEDKGYYAYLEDAQESLVTQMEGLGESLLLLAPELETNATRIQRIFDGTPRTANGIPCLWPPFDLAINPRDPASYYHNGRIWPFVQGYWAIAAARHGRADVFDDELNSLVHLALSSPSKGPKDKKGEDGPTFAEFYETNATHLWVRRRQLWSSAGYLGMVLQGLFGIQMEPTGLRFRPVKPKHMKRRSISLEGLTYRKAKLTIRVSGKGAVVESFAINKEAQKDPFLSATAEGEQLIEIVLKEA